MVLSGGIVGDNERHGSGVGNDCRDGTEVIIQADNAEELAETATVMVVVMT